MEAEGIEEALTPSHLLLGRRIHTLPDPVISATPVSNADTLTRRFRYLTKLSSHFWNRWRREYLLSLREHHKGIPNVQRESVIKIGDIVCIHEDSVPRSFLRLGRVKELVRGSDGQVKGAAIKPGDKGKRSNIICRPIQKLFPLETSRVNTKLEETDTKCSMKFSEQKSDVVRRVKRDAAVLGELKRRYVDN